MKTLSKNLQQLPINDTAQRIINTCEADFDANNDACNNFLIAVASDLGITLNGLADDIVDQIQGNGWAVLVDGPDAKAKADLGWFVVAGLKGADNVPPQDHGHVAVIVTGPLANGKYPTGYWGMLDGQGKKNTTINWAWNAASRDLVIYAGRQI